MPEKTFKPRDGTSHSSDSITRPHSAWFEDNGGTGYFYATDLSWSDNMILDVVHIYNVANVSNRDRESTISVLWSADGAKCALLINDYSHAAFDFIAKRGYCRTNYPNFPNTPPGCWDPSDHRWLDEAIAWFK